MSLSKQEASQVARRWATEQTDLPEGVLVMARKYDSSIKGRTVTVMFDVPAIPQNFMLVELRVFDDRSVQVKRDRRSYVRRHLAEREISMEDHRPEPPLDHAAAVNRFLEAFAVRSEKTPQWFRRLRSVEGVTYSGKADAYAEIEIPGSSRAAEVPIKIALSKAGKAKFNSRLSVRKQERQIVMIITARRDFDGIEDQLYHYLSEMRTKRVYR